MDEYNPMMLKYPNKFGTLYRFTDIYGGFDFHIHGIIDHMMGNFYGSEETLIKLRNED